MSNRSTERVSGEEVITEVTASGTRSEVFVLAMMFSACCIVVSIWCFICHRRIDRTGRTRSQVEQSILRMNLISPTAQGATAFKSSPNFAVPAVGVKESLSCDTIKTDKSEETYCERCQRDMEHTAEIYRPTSAMDQINSTKALPSVPNHQPMGYHHGFQSSYSMHHGNSLPTNQDASTQTTVSPPISRAPLPGPDCYVKGETPSPSEQNPNSMKAIIPPANRKRYRYPNCLNLEPSSPDLEIKRDSSKEPVRSLESPILPLRTLYSHYESTADTTASSITTTVSAGKPKPHISYLEARAHQGGYDSIIIT